MPRPVRVLLVGAGHVHAIVLRRWADEPPPQVELTVVTDRLELVYSGMTPGLVAGEYGVDDAVIDAEGLCRRAGASLVVDRVMGVDVVGGAMVLEAGGTLDYDVASLDVGSTMKGYHHPEIRAATVSAREARELDERLDALVTREGASPSAVVVGGGAAGVELAAAIHGRLGEGRVTLVEAAPRLMAGYAEGVSRRVERALTRRGVVVRLGESVSAVDAAAVTLASGDGISSDLTVWATGAAPPPLLAASGLPTDDDGFLRVDARLRVAGREDLFAAGDCAGVAGRDLAKAGFHAVKQAPVLFRNLKVAAEALRRPSDGPWGGSGWDAYEPRTDFLTLLNLGDGTALGTRWGLVVEGRWVRWLKDLIDRRFVARFRD